VSDDLDPVALLREHFTNMLPTTRRAAERVIAELEERRKIPTVRPAAPPELRLVDSGSCARCVEAEKLAVSLLGIFQGDDSRARVSALEKIRDLAGDLLGKERG
jgi:hypothetical protein